MELIRVCLKFHNCLTVSKVSRSDGLALLWTNDTKLSISSYSSYHIDAMVDDNVGKIWRFTRFYDKLSTSSKHISWICCEHYPHNGQVHGFV